MVAEFSTASFAERPVAERVAREAIETHPELGCYDGCTVGAYTVIRLPAPSRNECLLHVAIEHVGQDVSIPQYTYDAGDCSEHVYAWGEYFNGPICRECQCAYGEHSLDCSVEDTDGENDCPECARSYGNHYHGMCTH